jgi:hypothetical protein
MQSVFETRQNNKQSASSSTVLNSSSVCTLYKILIITTVPVDWL